MHFSHEEIMLQLYFDRALYRASSKKRLSFVVAKVSVYKKTEGRILFSFIFLPSSIFFRLDMVIW